MKNKGGRPSKQSPEVVKKLEEAFAIDASVPEACFYADISTVTFYNWMKANPRLFNRLEALRNKPVLKARKTVNDALNDPNHAFRYLEKKKRKEFGNSIDLTTDNQPINALSPEQQAKLDAILAGVPLPTTEAIGFHHDNDKPDSTPSSN